MPNHKSAKSACVRVSAVVISTRATERVLRGSIKKLRTALASNPKASGALLPTTVSEIDKAVQKGVLHREHCGATQVAVDCSGESSRGKVKSPKPPAVAGGHQ